MVIHQGNKNQFSGKIYFKGRITMTGKTTYGPIRYKRGQLRIKKEQGRVAEKRGESEKNPSPAPKHSNINHTKNYLLFYTTAGVEMFVICLVLQGSGLQRATKHKKNRAETRREEKARKPQPCLKRYNGII